MKKNIDNLAIKTIKINGVAAINLANSGHPGIVLGAAKITHALFTRHLIFDPMHPKWINRDRFILSAGHGSALLYSQLRLLNLISQDDLKNFRKLNSKTPGHPEFGLTKGIEATTGPLGQGLAVAVGIATAEAHLNSKFKEIDHYTYVLCGDGDLQEGITSEALSFAGKNNLKKLIILYDSNDIQLDSEVKDVFNENLEQKLKALNFNYQKIENNIEGIDQAIIKAKNSNKPSFIEIKTIIGEGSLIEGTTSVHGAPLGDKFKALKEKLNWEYDDFFIPNEVEELYQNTTFKRGNKAFKEFKISSKLDSLIKEQKILQIDDLSLQKNQATRVISGLVNDYIGNKNELWIGGSADLSCSTKIKGQDGKFSANNYQGRNILFGVREFSMAAIANGIALHSILKPFVSTFFVFIDYLKPALRLSALMKLPVTYIMTHDSIFVGEDGPTHQPIEQTALVRSIPNVNFIRPCDEKEVIGAYEIAYNSHNKPTVIALTRQNIISLPTSSHEKIKKGNYFILNNQAKWTLVASGSEIANCYRIAKEYNLNVVSISNSKDNIFWNPDFAITVEAATTFGLKKYGKYNIGINSFGASGNGQEVYKYFKLDYDNLKNHILEIINK